eukprot:403374382
MKAQAAMNLLSLPHRVQSGLQNDLIFYQFAVQFASSVAVTVATAVYLWGYETESKCEAPFNGDTDWGRGDEYVDVAKRFRDILKIWFAFGITDVFRCMLVFGYLQFKIRPLAWLYHILIINDILLVAAVLILHVYRFQFTGKWCSGDFLQESKPTDGFLVRRGKYLIGLVIYTWVGGFVTFCVYSCVVAATMRRFQEKYAAYKNTA